MLKPILKIYLNQEKNPQSQVRGKLCIAAKLALELTNTF